MMGNTVLPKYELQECDESFDLDDLLQNTQNLTRLAKPCTQLVHCVDRLRRWEPWSITLAVLIIANSACLMVESFYVVFSLLVLLSMAGLGYAHRQSNLLAKVLPLAESDPPRVLCDTSPTLDTPRDLVQSEILDEFKNLLFVVNNITRVITQSLTRFYSVLKWENFNLSLTCYIALIVLTLLLHIFPVRWTLTLLLDVFLLHYPFHQYLLVINNLRGSVRTRHKSEDLTVSDMESDNESLQSGLAAFTDSDRFTQSEPGDDDIVGQKGTLQYSTEENDKSEGGTSSDEAVEMKLGSVPTQTSVVNGKAKRPGMVGKILKTVKNQASSGSCAGCNVNFMTILKRRRLCSHCGNHFCVRCCSYKVTRSMFGATAPAAQTETVNVCFYCFNYLNKIYRSRGGSKTSLNSLGSAAGGGRQNGNGNGNRRSKSEGQAAAFEALKEKSQ